MAEDATPPVGAGLHYVIPGIGIGLVLMGLWVWFANPRPPPCTVNLACTEIGGPDWGLAGVLLVSGSLILLLWGLLRGITRLARVSSSRSLGSAPTHR